MPCSPCPASALSAPCLQVQCTLHTLQHLWQQAGFPCSPHSTMADSKRDAIAVHRARFVDFRPRRVTCMAASPSSKLLAVSYANAEVSIFRVLDSSHLVCVMVRTARMGLALTEIPFGSGWAGEWLAEFGVRNLRTRRIVFTPAPTDIAWISNCFSHHHCLEQGRLLCIQQDGVQRQVLRWGPHRAHQRGGLR